MSTPSRSSREPLLILALLGTFVIAALGGGRAIAQPTESPGVSTAPSVLESPAPSASEAPSEAPSVEPSVAATEAPSAAATTTPTQGAGPSESAVPTSRPSACRRGTGSQGQGDPYARIPQIVADVSPSVVTVFTDQAQGSGVIVGANGDIVTNNHVATSGSNLQVALVGQQDRVNATILGADPRVDLALIHIDQKRLPAATLSCNDPELGELAIAIGDPLGFENSVTVGVISGVHREIPGSAAQSPALVDLLQTDAAISPGNSGGALVGGDGTVIGINVAYIPPTTPAVAIGFAIPAATVRLALPFLRKGQPAPLAFMGIEPVTMTPALAQRFGLPETPGALVVQVVTGSPADTAGIKPGDIVTAVDGTTVASAEDLLQALRSFKPGDTVHVTVDRNGNNHKLDVTLGSPPVASPAP